MDLVVNLKTDDNTIIILGILQRNDNVHRLEHKNKRELRTPTYYLYVALEID